MKFKLGDRVLLDTKINTGLILNGIIESYDSGVYNVYVHKLSRAIYISEKDIELDKKWYRDIKIKELLNMFDEAKKVKKKRLSVTISQEVYTKLDELVEEKGLDKSKLVEVILNKYLNE